MTLKEFAIKVGYDGAAMKQFQQDCETAAGIAKRMGVLPPMPKELRGQKIQIKYISILTQAQRMMGIQPIQETLGFFAQNAQIETKNIVQFSITAFPSGNTPVVEQTVKGAKK